MESMHKLKNISLSFSYFNVKISLVMFLLQQLFLLFILIFFVFVCYFLLQSNICFLQFFHFLFFPSYFLLYYFNYLSHPLHYFLLLLLLFLHNFLNLFNIPFLSLLFLSLPLIFHFQFLHLILHPCEFPIKCILHS